ncbi:unnamed protein product [Diabrotica balteata]|uniref:Uncharacterized protein n=1 Tax=Diabrotica balteata TaxID=107213 RepID=A0A9N9XHU5_DIABA|nr:unnamed protein product [Diabrotica balteata]
MNDLYKKMKLLRLQTVLLAFCIRRTLKVPKELFKAKLEQLMFAKSDDELEDDVIVFSEGEDSDMEPEIIEKLSDVIEADNENVQQITNQANVREEPVNESYLAKDGMHWKPWIMVYNNDNDLSGIYVSPPDPNVLNDKDSADKNNGGFVDNLSRRQLLAEAELGYFDGAPEDNSVFKEMKDEQTPRDSSEEDPFASCDLDLDPVCTPGSSNESSSDRSQSTIVSSTQNISEPGPSSGQIININIETISSSTSRKRKGFHQLGNAISKGASDFLKRNIFLKKVILLEKNLLILSVIVNVTIGVQKKLARQRSKNYLMIFTPFKIKQEGGALSAVDLRKKYLIGDINQIMKMPPLDANTLWCTI